MHLLIPFASAVSEGGRGALAALNLPRLAALLARLQPAGLDAGDEWTLSPPHERALAREWGLGGSDGRHPFAAQQAAADGIDIGDAAWGLLSPTHWDVGADRVSLTDPQGLQLSPDESRAFLDAVAPLFRDDGYRLAYGAPDRWYAAHPMFAELATASLDRVIGRNVDRWLTGDPALRPIRRLQSEVQMLLHTHPLNAAREAEGRLPVNSFWLSGCGRAPQAQPVSDRADLVVADALREPALAEDWAAWQAAWQRLDDGPVAELLQRADRGDTVALTLAGERSAQRFEASSKRGLVQRVAARLRGSVDVRGVLQAL